MPMRSSSAGPEVPGIKASAREAEVAPPESESRRAAPESESGRAEPEPGGAAAAPEPEPGCSRVREERGRYPGSLVSRTNLGLFQGQTDWQICRLTRFPIPLSTGTRTTRRGRG